MGTLTLVSELCCIPTCMYIYICGCVKHGKKKKKKTSRTPQFRDPLLKRRGCWDGCIQLKTNLPKYLDRLSTGNHIQSFQKFSYHQIRLDLENVAIFALWFQSTLRRDLKVQLKKMIVKHTSSSQSIEFEIRFQCTCSNRREVSCCA
jgi:hypothetical protein